MHEAETTMALIIIHRVSLLFYKPAKIVDSTTLAIFCYISGHWLSIRIDIALAQYNNDNVTFNWLNFLANCFGITNNEQKINYSKYCDLQYSLIQIVRRLASIFAVKIIWDLISTKNYAYLYGINNSKYILEDNRRVIESHYAKYPSNSQNRNYDPEYLCGRPKEQWMI